jgi:hypothetical protein
MILGNVCEAYKVFKITWRWGILLVGIQYDIMCEHQGFGFCGRLNSRLFCNNQLKQLIVANNLRLIGE